MIVVYPARIARKSLSAIKRAVGTSSDRWLVAQAAVSALRRSSASAKIVAPVSLRSCAHPWQCSSQAALSSSKRSNAPAVITPVTSTTLTLPCIVARTLIERDCQFFLNISFPTAAALSRLACRAKSLAHVLATAGRRKTPRTGGCEYSLGASTRPCRLEIAWAGR